MVSRNRFFAGDVMTCRFQSAVYDVVVSSAVIEHLPAEHQERFIDILAERLAPNGYLILTTPNKLYSERLHKWQPIEEHFSANELQKLLSHRFNIRIFTPIHRLFPILGHHYRIFQGIRVGMYEVLKLRGLIENPFRAKNSGLYFVVLAQRR